MLQLHLSKNSSFQLCVTIQVFLSNFLLLVSKKKVTRYLLHVKYSLVHSNMETVKRLVVFRSLGLGSNEQAEHGGFLGHWSYLVWYYNDRFMSLYISSNWNVQHQEQTFSSVQFSSVTQSCLTRCDPMNRSTPGLPVHHQLQEFTQTHVHQVGDAIQPSHPLSYPSPPACNPSKHQALFQWVSICMRWPKYWSFSLSISSSNEHPGLISFRMDWLDLLAVQGTRKSLLQHHSSKASIHRHSAFFIVQLSHPHMITGKTIALTRWTFVGKVISAF